MSLSAPNWTVGHSDFRACCSKVGAVPSWSRTKSSGELVTPEDHAMGCSRARGSMGIVRWRRTPIIRGLSRRDKPHLGLGSSTDSPRPASLLDIGRWLEADPGITGSQELHYPGGCRRQAPSARVPRERDAPCSSTPGPDPRISRPQPMHTNRPAGIVSQRNPLANPPIPTQSTTSLSLNHHSNPPVLIF